MAGDRALRISNTRTEVKCKISSCMSLFSSITYVNNRLAAYTKFVDTRVLRLVNTSMMRIQNSKYNIYNLTSIEDTSTVSACRVVSSTMTTGIQCLWWLHLQTLTSAVLPHHGCCYRIFPKTILLRDEDIMISYNE